MSSSKSAKWSFVKDYVVQVGKLILAHVTKGDYPYWDKMYIWSAIGAIDANSQFLFGRYVFTILLITTSF
jgi:hypothetical protein